MTNQNVKFLKKLFLDVVNASKPNAVMKNKMPKAPMGETFVVAIGKAGAEMAKVVEQKWKKKIEGIAIVPDGHECQCENIEIHQARHPLPDKRGMDATKKIIEKVKKLKKDDLLLCLISGGGSALMCLPKDNVLSLQEKINVNKELLMSGANIEEINIVRKHLSEVKGGNLARIAQPASVATLAISDVPMDNPATIASGPTVPDPSSLQDAVEILRKYKIEVSEKIKKHLQSKENETPKPEDAIFQNTQYEIIYKPNDMIKWAEQNAKKNIENIMNLGADVQGEASVVAKQHAELVRENKNNVGLILSGGETTVSIRHKNKKYGKGGRNTEYLLALCVELKGEKGVYALAADTDGIDGNGTNAGAIITPDTLERGEKLGMNANEFLKQHDSFSYFEKLGDLITTGPTRTNLNDFRAIRIVAE